METLRHWYVTPFGGTSPDLDLSQVGILRDALELNTRLDPTVDRVRVSVVGHGRLRPLLMDRFFEVVALDETHPDALEHSPMGEAVLPEADAALRREDAPRPGDEVLLNGVWSARVGTLPDPGVVMRAILDLLRRGS